MRVVSISQAKNLPSDVLQQAKQNLVMLTNHSKPATLLVSIEHLANVPNIQQAKLVIAINLFREKQLSAASAARFAGKPLSEMLTLLSEMRLPVVDYNEGEQQAEADLIERMAKSDS